jgi:hypothetical protein
VNFIDYINFKSRPVGPVYRVFTKLSNLIYAVITGAVDLDNVDIVTGINGDTAVAFTARLDGRLVGLEAIQRFGQNSSQSRLADAPGSAEQVGVSDTVGLDGIFQGLCDRVLTDNVIENLRTIFPRQNSISHDYLLNFSNIHSAGKNNNQYLIINMQ